MVREFRLARIKTVVEKMALEIRSRLGGVYYALLRKAIFIVEKGKK